MLETFEVKKPFYPLISFFASIIVLIFGMLFSKNISAFAFAFAVFVLFSAFGLFKNSAKMTLAMGVCGLIIGGLSFLTNRSSEAFWQTLLRMILLGLCAVPMVSTSPCDLTRCLAKMKCPRVITLGMLVTLRFIPVLASEIKQIWEAMKVRGANVSWYRPSTIYRAFIIPLVMRIIGISDTLSLSLETRAFTLDDSKSSVYKVIEVKTRDFVFLICVIALCVSGGVMMWK
ncbi:MAG TPA: hypothetical protein DCQ76_05895 [Ruminococcaceae bacterium]|nr:hypothetical protein [Oscillospiraceae bacterium]